MDEMQALLTAAWLEWDRARGDAADSAVVPAASAPVPWFGNLPAYRASGQKVVTIAVNPGPTTFNLDNWGNPDNPEDFQYLRNSVVHLAAMNAYPVQKWFPRWNGLLEPLGARYPSAVQQPLANTPLHLDVTPLATVPKFSQCPADVQARLRAKGVALLVDLLKILKPDILFLSVSQPHFVAIQGALNLANPVPVQLGQHQVVRYDVDWVKAGAKLLWLRKTNFAPVGPGHHHCRLLGTWMAGGVQPPDEQDAAPPQPERLAHIGEVVQKIEDSFDGEDNPLPEMWIQQNNVWKWSRDVHFLAPDRRSARLSQGAKLYRVLKFLADWQQHEDGIRAGPWGEKAAKGTQHVTFPVPGGSEPGGLKHYRGLYFRWVPQS